MRTGKTKDTKHSQQNEFTMLRSYGCKETAGYIPRKLTQKQREMVERIRREVYEPTEDHKDIPK